LNVVQKWINFFIHGGYILGHLLQLLILEGWGVYVLSLIWIHEIFEVRWLEYWLGVHECINHLVDAFVEESR
jgi:hypothetical protein